MNKGTDRILPLFAIVLIIASVLSSKLSESPRNDIQNVRCVIDIKTLDDTTRGLITGYNYYLITRWARENDRTIDIRLSRKEENLADSLREHSIDIVVTPMNDSIAGNFGRNSRPVDSLTYWIVCPCSKGLLKDINRWLDDWHSSDEYELVRMRFLNVYDPFRRRGGQPFISPYDDIIKEYADSIGWDWRMLSAIIYQESRFKINALSPRGASGLMQMTEATASRMNAGDLLNPDESIRAGSYYLRTLYKMFPNAATEDERIKFTLAAYNAGGGRIKDCINYSRYRGLEGNTWDQLLEVIPDMSSDEVASLDTIKCGTFKGVETTAYVDRILALYKEFCRICP